MITFAPLWRTMQEKGVTTYTLRVKHGMSHATVQRLQRNMPVSTITLNRLCELLDCSLTEIAAYIKES
ncbi:XRE family transcriptional regulator [Ethanoligenens harbinense]|nr:XRE family transcriptional regulator [Ethanoligenens harbinense YUAN-3]AYF38015.1 XRE family transcriptional regulator [Ethanoligenens harbinense]AYF40760.1 XRE family transcriptional regulator [Ethanoligenens harbinense]QCN93588.1 XRE family transcriptional regulator [Ethanoligenens harbinense]